MKGQPQFVPGPCPYEHDDGAYILGALGPADRAEYERHLTSCPSCRDAVTQLAVLPGLLGRLDPTTAEHATRAPASVLPRVLAAMRAQRTAQRRHRLLAGAAAAVAVMAVAAIIGLAVRSGQAPPGPDPSIPVAFRPMHVDGTFAPMEAQIGITEEEAGTRVTVRCLYQGAPYQRWEIWLVVYPRQDEAESIGSWNAIGGTPIEVSAVTHYPPAQIDRFELRTDNTTVAWWFP